MFPRLSAKTKDIIKSIPTDELDNVYRFVRFNYTKNDIISHLEDMDNIELTDEQIEKAAELYAYEGKYDCNLSYWNNIENLIHLVREN